MIYFFAEDSKYYTQESMENLKEEYQLDDIIPHPIFQDVIDTTGRNIALMASYLPSDFDRKMKNSNYFSVVELPNEYGILTSGQKRLGIDESVIMEQRYGVSFYRPTETFEDLGGAIEFKNYVKRILAMEALNIKIKGIFMVGVPGTGKSFSAKCFAGSTGRVLVALNLSTLMYLPNPIFALNAIFELLSKQNEKFIIWIDEIEKQMSESEKSKQILGALLTMLNDMNTSSSKYSADVIFIATANNLKTISEKNPEFLRKGRFDELFFLNYQKSDNAKAVFEIYRKKTNSRTKNELFYRVLFKRVNTRIGFVDIQENDNEDSIKKTLNPIMEKANMVFKELKTIIDIVEKSNTTIIDGKMVIGRENENTLHENTKKENLSIQKQDYILAKFKENYLDKYGKSEEHKESHNLFFHRLECDFNIDKMYQLPEIIYEDKKINPSLYIYTPSEIENYVAEWFSYKIQQENMDEITKKYEVDDDTHKYLVRRLIPLQVGMKDGIEALVAQRNQFVEIN